MGDEDPPDTGVGNDVVTITAPAHTLNWAMVGIVMVAAWWLYSNWHPTDDGYGDDDED